MSNRYGLPEAEVDRVRMRDTLCVYCRKRMFTPAPGVPRGDWATIEHLNHLPPWNNPRTIAICCGSCNSSRGRRTILTWFASAYCTTRNINPATVAKPVLDYTCEFEGFGGSGGSKAC
jgi:hypothetical protein